MGHLIGAALGGLVIMFLLSRLALWLLKRMGDTARRVLIAHGLAFSMATLLGAFGFAND